MSQQLSRMPSYAGYLKSYKQIYKKKYLQVEPAAAETRAVFRTRQEEPTSRPARQKHFLNSRVGQFLYSRVGQFCMFFGKFCKKLLRSNNTPATED